MTTGNDTLQNEQQPEEGIDLNSAVAMAFLPFGVNDEEIEFMIESGKQLSENISFNLIEWCKANRGDVDIVGVGAAYIAVHALFSRYNKWLHDELDALQEFNRKEKEEANE